MTLNFPREDIFLSIVMPGYNEGRYIYENLLKTCKIIEEFCPHFEVVFVNDGSKDNTAEMAQKAALVDSRIHCFNNVKNMGKGKALKAGVQKAQGNIIAFLDSDLDISPSLIKRYLHQLQSTEADVVIGSKLHVESQLEYPPLRRFMSFCYYLMLMVLFRLNVKDTQTGLKVFKSAALIPAIKEVKVDRFAFDIELLLNIHSLGYKITDAPVVIKFTRGQQWGRIRPKDILHVFFDTMKIFVRLRFQKKKNTDYISPESAETYEP